MRSRSRLASRRATAAFAVWALPEAAAARALSVSARARSTWARWFRTAASATSTSARAWLTLASKLCGSMRATSWSRLTWELKSAKSSRIWPETWEPTCTVTTAFRLPVAETAAVMGPRATAWVRKRGAVPVLWV